jgi:hypothetical protein
MAKEVAKKGDKYLCEECGFMLVVEKPCSCSDSCTMICDGKKMKLIKN